MFKYLNIDSSGFTLMEIIIVIGIMSGIVLMVTMFSIDIFDFGIFLTEDLSAQRELQLTLRVMSSEIRAMGPSAGGAYAIESASQNSLTFYSDIDGDGITERIRYFLSGNTFRKGVIKPTGNPISYPSAEESIRDQVHYVFAAAGNIFSYYNSSYSGSEAPLIFPVNISEVRLIKANITVDQSPLEPSSRINFSTSVNIRNL